MILAALLVTIAGCGAFNDNPTDASKMSEIRHKEAAARANFNPAMTPSPSGK